ncbi:hypothetical protein KP806_23885 [Paenibacillus sp. N4]|uniref:hypothetical protein n=1 Tax=Paenibacillus vietnamensis TaxID=2590547 RepID=UPI001CD0F4DE|nr:hypothetical protein [Paenibacillus vietnamensis]MCA0758105.1 hypothetical protein [Paenibacillus vietnamensis]
MPDILVQIAFLIIFIWSVVMLVQDFKVSRKAWMNILLHASVAVVSIHFLGF